MPDFDLVVRGGRVVDGTGAPGTVTDVGVRDGRVVSVERLRHATATRELDATGLVVGPGFVDLHTHYDAQVFWDPYCTISGWHGVTSVVIGNCGFGFAPVRPEDRTRAMLTLTRNEAISLRAMEIGVPFDWVSFPEFLGSLERTPKGVNVASLAPLAPILVWVMGLEAAKERSATPDEQARFREILHESMDAGAAGFSFQMMGRDSIQPDYDGSPMVTDTMSVDDVMVFADVLGERDEGFIQCNYSPYDVDDQRDRATRNAETMAFLERLAERARRPIVNSTVHALAHAPEAHRAQLAWLADANRRGLPIWGQADEVRNWFQFTFEDFNMFDTAPAWRRCFVGTTEEKLAHLADPTLRAEMLEQKHLLRALMEGAGAVERFRVIGDGGSAAVSAYLGRTLGEIAAEEARDPFAVMLELALASGLKVELQSGFTKTPDPALVAEMLRSPHVVPGLSDGGAHMKYLVGAAYATDFLQWLVREEGVFTVEEAHHKLSFLPARAAGLRGRGALLEGYAADLVVYDLDRVKAQPDLGYATAADLPGGDWRRIQQAEGYRWIVVNGEVTFEDGACSGATPGQLLRSGRPR